MWIILGDGCFVYIYSGLLLVMLYKSNDCFCFMKLFPCLWTLQADDAALLSLWEC